MIKVIALFAFGFFLAQGAGSGQDVRTKLFKQILADDPDLRECLKDQSTAPTEANLTIEERDLNGDGIAEYEVQLSGMCACGAQNCTIYLYRRSGTAFQSILEGASGLGLDVLTTASNGYRDLRIDAHDSAATQSRTIYKFDGRQYREAKATIVHMGTGESKPAFRRVQFPRGSSSARVAGKVSLAMPDTYLVGARAGQEMTIQLTAPNKSIRIMVMAPKTTAMLADNARSWTGTLPETGDYNIVVDGDERGGTYTMTITIK